MLSIFKPAPHKARLPAAEIDPTYRRLRWQIFLGIFFGYAAYYLVRKNFALAMPYLVEQGFSRGDLGFALSGISIAYGFSKFIMGSVSDRSNPRVFLPAGLLLAAAVMLFMGFVPWATSSIAVMFVLLFLCGWFQGMGWPPCGRTMVHWWSQKERGGIVSVWNCAHNVGGGIPPLLFLLGSTVLNVALDLLFILVLRWGVAGAAGATVTAQLISTVACFAYAFSKYPDLRLHKEDWRITGLDLKRHIVQGVPLGLQFSVLAIGIIVMQSVVVKFDMIDGQMVSHAAQNGFGAANKLNSLIMTPVNGLGAAMTSFTAQNLGAGYTHRIRKGILQGLVMAAIIGVCSVGLGLLLTIDGAYLHIFLSADKVTADTIRFGNHFLYVDFSMYLLLCFLFVVRNCVQGIQRAPFVLWAGASELIARVAICLTLPALLSGGVVSAQSPELAFYALCAADPLAWLAADLVLLVPFFKNMMHRNYQYLYGGVEQHLLGK